MPPTTATDPDPNLHLDQTGSKAPSTESATNHDLPARSGTEDEFQDQSQSDDAATMAASEELRHTTISDRVNPAVHQEGLAGGSEPHGEDKDMGENVRSNTPEHDDLKERLSSPKKKRGRDFEEDTRDMDGTGETELTTVGGAVNINRTSRSEPEKKRPRDASEETTTATRGADTEKVS